MIIQCAACYNPTPRKTSRYRERPKSLTFLFFIYSPIHCSSIDPSNKPNSLAPLSPLNFSSDKKHLCFLFFSLLIHLCSRRSSVSFFFPHGFEHQKFKISYPGERSSWVSLQGSRNLQNLWEFKSQCFTFKPCCKTHKLPTDQICKIPKNGIKESNYQPQCGPLLP